MSLRTILQSLICLLCSTVVGKGQGNENFVVNGPDEAISRAVLEEAQRLRTALSREWLQDELPPGLATTAVFVRFSSIPDVRVSVPDSPERLSSVIWLDIDESGPTPGSLEPAIVQAVIATRYPGKLPAWVVNGIGSQYETRSRRSSYCHIVNWFRDTENWPGLSEVLNANYLPGKDLRAQAIAYSLTEYLLTKGNRGDLLHFGQLGKESGWDEALESVYKISNVEALDTIWREWVRRDTRSPQAEDRIYLEEPLCHTAIAPPNIASEVEIDR